MSNESLFNMSDISFSSDSHMGHSDSYITIDDLGDYAKKSYASKHGKLGLWGIFIGIVLIIIGLWIDYKEKEDKKELAKLQGDKQFEALNDLESDLKGWYFWAPGVAVLIGGIAFYIKGALPK